MAAVLANACSLGAGPALENSCRITPLICKVILLPAGVTGWLTPSAASCVAIPFQGLVRRGARSESSAQTAYRGIRGDSRIRGTVAVPEIVYHWHACWLGA